MAKKEKEESRNYFISKVINSAELSRQSQVSPFFVPAPDGLPFTFAFALEILALSLIANFHNTGALNFWTWPVLHCVLFDTSTTTYYPLYESLLGVIFCIIVWFIKLIQESVILGMHTLEMQKGFKYGFILFLISEVMFFFAIFWSYLYFYINPSIWIGGVWPPIGIESLNFLHLPLANTVILISSGFSVNWAHQWIILGKIRKAIIALTLTIFYGLLFAWLQFLEYGLAQYAINDSVYGSIFYLGTGFHGAHVLLGVMGLTISLYRLLLTIYSRQFHTSRWQRVSRVGNDQQQITAIGLTFKPWLSPYFESDINFLWNQKGKQITRQHHVGFWSAAIYWHFVDVIWIFLYAIFYVWGTI